MGKIVGVTFGGNNLYSSVSLDHGQTWTTYNLNTGVSLGSAYGVTYGGTNNAYLVVTGTLSGGTTGKSFRSRDGQVWETSSTLSYGMLDSVGSGNGDLIISTTTNATKILKSSDGLTWTEATVTSPGSGLIWNKIATEPGLGQFIMLSNDYSKSAYSSNNGLTWTYNTHTSRTSGGNGFPSIINTTSGFESVHATGFVRRTSSTVWTNFPGPGGSYVCQAMAANNATRVIVGDDSGSATDVIYYSTNNGSSWNEVVLPVSAFWNSAEYDGTNFVVSSSVAGALETIISPDGINWTEVTSPIVQMTSLFAFTPQPIPYSGSSSITRSTPLLAMLRNFGRTVSILGESADLFTFKGWKKDLTLTQLTEVSSSVPRFDFGRSIVLSAARELTNLKTHAEWHLYTSLMSIREVYKIHNKFWGRPWSMIYEFGKWIGVKGNALYGAISADGIIWTKTNLPAQRSWNGIASNGTIIVSLASGSDKASTSTDGTTWVEQTLPASKHWMAICSDGVSRFVAVALNSDTCYTTEDGVVWTERSLPFKANWTSVAYGAGRFVAISDSNKAAYSADGETWTPVLMPDNIHYNCVTYHLDQFTAVASGPTDLAAISTTGTSWTRITMPAVADWTSVGPGVGNPDE